MIRRPPRSTLSSSSAASDVYKRQVSTQSTGNTTITMLGRLVSWAQQRLAFGHGTVAAGPGSELYHAKRDESLFDMIFEHVVLRIDRETDTFRMAWLQHWEEDLFWHLTTETVTTTGICERIPNGVRLIPTRCDGGWVGSLGSSSLDCGGLLPALVEDGVLSLCVISANNPELQLRQEASQPVQLPLRAVTEEILRQECAGVYPSGREAAFATPGLLASL
eukprot:TRINITY_DN36629_c0_g1_i1.p1 TRINITY_DN36629_c0_g1~~TRINITY_DN36629_c0_g1_i1.p1  ORF type:complete len:220 (-),score=50.81 TRINITY_DN36629_c0_g1_i1:265-924(-)